MSSISDTSVTETPAYQRLLALSRGLESAPKASSASSSAIKNREIAIKTIFKNIRGMQTSDASHSRGPERSFSQNT